jgi:diguanylate cyclase (GGDEF)-like protein/PAS domain S-box-containing protein
MLVSSSFRRKIIQMELVSEKTNLQVFFNKVEDIFITGNLTGTRQDEIINPGNDSFMTDTANQVKLLNEIKKQKLRYENIIASTRIATWEWNIKTGSLEINERWAEIIGYTLEELKPITIDTWKKFAHPDDYKESWEPLRKYFAGKSDYYNFETRMKHKNGSWIWVIDKGKVIQRDREGNPLLLMGTHSDISSRKRDEILLQETEKRLDLAMKGTGAGLWDWDMINNQVFFSPMWKSMLGYTDDDIINTFEGWKNLWHPDDAPLIEKAIKDYLDGKTGKYEITHRLRHKNGQWRWILTRGDLLKDKHGKPYRWVGTNIDITTEKERSNELERFFSVNLDLLCIADTEGNFIKVNKAWTDILGHSTEVLEKSKFLDFIHPEDLSKTMESLKTLSEKETVTNFVNRYRHRDGSYRFIEWRTHPYGKLLYASARDITKRLESENKFREMAIKDSLTGIYNRRFILERLENLLSEYKRKKNIFSISIIDLDHFKNINDTYGHQAGDFILKEFSKLISSNLRPYDLQGRYGGEEFLLISEDTTREQARLTIERILEITRNNKFVYNGKEISFTFSCGISDASEIEDNDISIERLIEKADKKLYKAKKNGRNQVIAHEQGMI